ncbi:MAG: PspC domain-containing protein [Prolixibacteraceae bacterium]
MKRLRKSKDTKIAGVCGGISEYINPELDPLLIRVVYSIFSVFIPPLVLVYFILAIAIPDPQMA